ncbi:MAG: exodeoxyribonuclease VII small subunit [Deltaproteobacteria bacterium]|nr:MAG: exodeoxyribonuclease VII small subunit [Deltaproteobacteria bacterium]
MAPKNKPSFEKAINDLEKIVKVLESGDLPLEKALQKFESGIELSQYCSEMLEDAEQRVSLMMGGKTDAPERQPFEIGD